MRKAHQKTWTLYSGEDLQPRHTLFNQAYTHLQLGEMISLDHWLWQTESAGKISCHQYDVKRECHLIWFLRLRERRQGSSGQVGRSADSQERMGAPAPAVGTIACRPVSMTVSALTDGHDALD